MRKGRSMAPLHRFGPRVVHSGTFQGGRPDATAVALATFGTTNARKPFEFRALPSKQGSDSCAVAHMSPRLARSPFGFYRRPGRKSVIWPRCDGSSRILAFSTRIEAVRLDRLRMAHRSPHGGGWLSGLARRLGVPYPVFLALGGVALAFVPDAPNFTLDPELALALFIAPVLLDAAYDTSLRDLKKNWVPVAGLAIGAVGLTTLLVAAIAHLLVPTLPSAAAIALGAIVAPPDAAAATAVVRHLNLPQRVITIIEGDNLLNDASALLTYRLAVGAVAAGGFSAAVSRRPFSSRSPAASWSARSWPSAISGSPRNVSDAPTAIILQFAGFRDLDPGGAGRPLRHPHHRHLRRHHRPQRPCDDARPPARTGLCGLGDRSSSSTCSASSSSGSRSARSGAGLEPASVRVRPGRGRLLLTVILARFIWVYAIPRRQAMCRATQPEAPTGPGRRPQPGWSSPGAACAGIVTLAAAFALPADFPERDLSSSAPSRRPRLAPRAGPDPQAASHAVRFDDGDAVTIEVGRARAVAYRRRLRRSTRISSPKAKRCGANMRAAEGGGAGPEGPRVGELPADRLRVGPSAPRVRRSTSCAARARSATTPFTASRRSSTSPSSAPEPAGQ